MAIRPESRVSQKLVLALDYHQVLDRSKTEAAWAVQRVPRENLELIRKPKNDLGDRLIICVCSHIERSEKNLRDLIRCIHNTDGVQDLIEFVTITTQRTGALGKLPTTLAAICQRRVPCMIIDDNAEVIAGCSGSVPTAHLKLRRKPQAPRAHRVKGFLEECEGAVKEVFDEEVVQ